MGQRVLRERQGRSRVEMGQNAYWETMALCFGLFGVGAADRQLGILGKAGYGEDRGLSSEAGALGSARCRSSPWRIKMSVSRPGIGCFGV